MLIPKLGLWIFLVVIILNQAYWLWECRRVERERDRLAARNVELTKNMDSMKWDMKCLEKRNEQAAIHLREAMDWINGTRK